MQEFLTKQWESLSSDHQALLGGMLGAWFVGIILGFYTLIHSFVRRRRVRNQKKLAELLNQDKQDFPKYRRSALLQSILDILNFNKIEEVSVDGPNSPEMLLRSGSLEIFLRNRFSSYSELSFCSMEPKDILSLNVNNGPNDIDLFSSDERLEIIEAAWNAWNRTNEEKRKERVTALLDTLNPPEESKYKVFPVPSGTLHSYDCMNQKEECKGCDYCEDCPCGCDHEGGDAEIIPDEEVDIVATYSDLEKLRKDIRNLDESYGKGLDALDEKLNSSQKEYRSALDSVMKGCNYISERVDALWKTVTDHLVSNVHFPHNIELDVRKILGELKSTMTSIKAQQESFNEKLKEREDRILIANPGASVKPTCEEFNEIIDSLKSHFFKNSVKSPSENGNSLKGC